MPFIFKIFTTTPSRCSYIYLLYFYMFYPTLQIKLIFLPLIWIMHLITSHFDTKLSICVVWCAVVLIFIVKLPQCPVQNVTIHLIFSFLNRMWSWRVKEGGEGGQWWMEVKASDLPSARAWPALTPETLKPAVKHQQGRIRSGCHVFLNLMFILYNICWSKQWFEISAPSIATGACCHKGSRV